MYKKMTENNRKKISFATIEVIPAENKIILSGEWTWVSINENILNIVDSINKQNWLIDGLEIKRIDTTGAYFLHKLCDCLTQLGSKVTAVNLILED